MIAKVPDQFRPRQNSPYPPYCTEMMVEQYVSRHYNGDSDRIYLPVYWTNYYCNNGYGHGRIEPLLQWLGALDKSKKYWTVVQYDDGILQKPEGLDILVFSAGNPSGIPIPLIPSHYLEVPNVMKGYDLTFIGNINNHPIRKQLIEETGCWKMDGLLPQDYYKVLAQSDFTLCPRGYGVTSFRIYEALHCGAVPVIVSDIDWLPYSRMIDWNRIALIVHPDEIGNIRGMMASHVQDWGYYNQIKGLFEMQGILDYIQGFLSGKDAIERYGVKIIEHV